MKKSIPQWCATTTEQQRPHRSHQWSISHYWAVEEPARGSGQFAYSTLGLVPYGGGHK